MESTVAGESPAPAVTGGARDAPAGRGRRVLGSARRSPFATSLIGCVILAALSAAVLPTVPSYDPWSWVVWGREVSDPHLSFIVNGGPSWKPLPVMFTTVFGLFGGAAPTLWVIAARAGGLMAFVAAYRLAALLVTRGGTGRAAPAAGVLAAAGLVMTQDWAYYWFRGASEVVLVGAALWAVERLIAGRRRETFALGVVLGLMRPEAWPFMIAFGGWLALREPALRVRLAILAGLLFMPFAWFAPPGVSTGQPFLAATHASDYNGHLGAHPLIEVLRRGVDDQSVAILVLALIAVAITLVRERERLILWAAAGAGAWWVVVVAMTVDGYPGLERFFLPAAAVACVLAGVGVVRIGALAAELASGAAGGSVGGSEGPGRLAGPARCVGLAAGLAVTALAVLAVHGRIGYARAQEPLARHAVTRLDQLSAAVAAVGGHRGVYPCKSSFAAVNHSVQTALAWKLHVTLERVGTAMRHPGVLFVGPHDTIDGAPAPIADSLNRVELIRRVGPWRIYRVYRYGHSTACVGG